MVLSWLFPKAVGFNKGLRRMQAATDDVLELDLPAGSSRTTLLSGRVAPS
jgi:hypothetical protein